MAGGSQSAAQNKNVGEGTSETRARRGRGEGMEKSFGDDHSAARSRLRAPPQGRFYARGNGGARREKKRRQERAMPV
jgi:hypothetical protein